MVTFTDIMCTECGKEDMIAHAGEKPALPLKNRCQYCGGSMRLKEDGDASAGEVSTV